MSHENKMHESLPVEGYRPQGADKVNLVNSNKRMEEETLRVLDHLGALPDVDKRWLAIGRTDMEKAWMAVNRAIFKPDRVKL
jgi:hypothetical protein